MFGERISMKGIRRFLNVSIFTIISINLLSTSYIFNAYNTEQDTVNNRYINNIEIINEYDNNNQLTFNQLVYQSKQQYILLITIIMIFIFFLILYLNIKKKKEIKVLLEYDQLTHLYRRDKFIIEANKILSNARSQEYLILTIDIDSFRNINTNYGYDEGSNLLVILSKVLKQKYPNSLICRDNADQFILLLENTYNGQALCGEYNCEGCINKRVEDLCGGKYRVNLSRGIYIIDDIKLDVGTMISYSNYARLREKNSYGTTLTLFTNGMLSKIKLYEQIDEKIEEGFNNNEFYPVYQPQINIIDKKIDGAELLIRWKNKDGVIYQPDSFIPVLENNGFIFNIDCFMLEQACIFIKEHPELDFPLAVNLSNITILKNNIVEILSNLINKYKVPANKLEVEITESSFATNTSLIKYKIKQINRMGIKTTIDDFGTGISSLNRLKDLDVHTLKIDKSFLDESLMLDKGVLILESIIEMTKKLGLNIIVEGVETEEQLAIIKKLGGDIVQGYYFSKPLEKEQFIEYINTFSIEEIYELKYKNIDVNNLLHLFNLHELPFGVMVCSNDEHLTILKVNNAFYNTIHKTKLEFDNTYDNKLSDFFNEESNRLIIHNKSKLESFNYYYNDGDKTIKLYVIFKYDTKTDQYTIGIIDTEALLR